MDVAVSSELSGAAESFYVSGEVLQLACRRTTREAFVREHPALWLVQDLSSRRSDEPSFATAHLDIEHVLPASARLQRLGRLPARLALFPVSKSGKNPWKDRILIGRATNNDVVLRDPSVSKVHARAALRDGTWVLSDAGSTNGTWVDDRPLTPQGPGSVLRSGVTVKLGSVHVTLLSAGELYDALK